MRSKCHISISGFLFYHLLPIRRKIVLDNIDRVFKNQLSLKEKKHLAWAFYSHVASTIKELIFMDWYARFDNCVEIKGIEHLLEAKKQGQGCFLLMGHLGNWEFTISLVFSQLKSLIGPIWIIRKAIRIKWLERFIFKRNLRYGGQRIDKTGAPLKIIKALKSKETILFTMDQHAELKNKEGIAVNFFNAKAGTFRSLALFAGKYQVPVVPLSCYRQADGKHVLEFYPALSWEPHTDQEQAIYNNTLRYNQKLEQLILEHPEQWWWVHRRWKI
ncbi:lysophospholipid acyltransferase family protein [Legionella parisiensis]|uniref:Lipid A biosynthesis lauroyltransferase n=1 Tax=Legionella parisiensis TaxID=45071 RepID=A0A1E5JQN6_9GAMM|nr:lysophospholipid acyltransferase family protein [Legionella parisiensis]KTD43187.1 lipid A lauroyl acyltransferase [Legionella parisiensis]OEH46839.1 Lipid A biosynthesis lauroyltransferase [Legionella parisiensis]STX77732.1 lipid A lauroyl acyltransferase [Legionella parisiensis]